MTITDVVFIHTMNKPQLIHWHSRRHAHEAGQYELHYFIHGEGTFENNRTTRSIRPGSLYLTLPGQVHKIHPRNLDRPLSYYAALFTLQADEPVYPLVNDPGFQTRFPLRLRGSQRFVLEEIKSSFSSENPYQRAAGEHRLLAFLYQLYGEEMHRRGMHGQPSDRNTPDSPASAHDVLQTPSEAAQTGRTPSAGPHTSPGLPAPGTNRGGGDFHLQLEQAASLFQEHLFSRISLDQVCQRLDISKEHLIRLFNRHLHTTPMRYYTHLKIEAASSMLINSDLSLKEIAWELGFSSPFHLSKRFKEHTGSTPSAYRKRYFRENPTGYHTKIIDPELETDQDY